MVANLRARTVGHPYQREPGLVELETWANRALGSKQATSIDYVASLQGEYTLPHRSGRLSFKQCASMRAGMAGPSTAATCISFPLRSTGRKSSSICCHAQGSAQEATGS